MAQDRRRDRFLVRNDTSKFLNTLLENPDLPEYVAQLAPPTLNKLIAHVGPEDSGALIIHATDRQLRSVLDETLWGNLTPGEIEQLKPEEFVRWLYVFQEQGTAAFADRLVGLGLDYAVMNFGQLIGVATGEAIRSDDYEAIERYGDNEGYAEEFEGYFVTAEFDEEWDITREALLALQDFAPQYLRLMLSRLALGHAETLIHDVAGERRDTKESAGFVSPESAKAFFALTDGTDLSSIIFGANLDPVSVRYFSQLGEYEGSEPDLGPEDEERTEESQAVEAQEASVEQSESRNFHEMDTLLKEAEILTPNSTLLLTEPEPSEELPIKRAVDLLQDTDPHSFSDRLAELVYLSNTLIAGETVGGKRFDQVEAAQAALAACNFGWSHLQKEFAEEIDEAVSEGLVRLFRIGWKLLRDVPQHAVAEISAVLRSAEFADSVYDKRWVLDEIETTLDELKVEVGARKFGEARTSITFISLVLEDEVSEALQKVVSEYPQFPLDSEVRYFESVADVERVAKFLTRLRT